VKQLSCHLSGMSWRAHSVMKVGVLDSKKCEVNVNVNIRIRMLVVHP